MNSLVRSLLGSLIVLCVSAPAHSAEATKTTNALSASSSPKNFEVSWTRVTLGREAAAREELAMLRARHSAGLATDEQLSRATYALKEAEERAPYLLTIRSLGGTLKEFIDVASRSDDVSLNVINAGDPADLEIKLPPFELRNADWGTVIEVLANFLATRGLQLKHAGGGSGGDSAVSRSVVCVLRPIEVIPNMSRSAQPEFEAFQLAPYIIESPRAGDKGQDISVVVDAILAAWTMTGAQINFAQSSALEWSDKQSRMKYHPATKMLFISGPPSAIAVARQVISNLPKNAGYK